MVSDFPSVYTKIRCGASRLLELYVRTESGSLEAVFYFSAEGAAAVFHLEEDVVVDKFADGETGAGWADFIGAGRALVAIHLDAVPPCGRMVSRGAQIEDEFEAGDRAGDELVGGTCGAFVGIVDNDDGVFGEIGKRERDPVVLIAKRVAAVVELGADAGRTPWRVDKKTAEVEVVEGYLAGRGVSVEGVAERFVNAVVLREIVASKHTRARISARGADETRPFVASDFNVHFVLAECADRGVEEREFVLGGHPGDLLEDVRERAITGMPRLRETAGVGELGPQLAASRDEGVKVHSQ
jgi:hypothetical protein